MSDIGEEKRPFRVIVVGGGIAGLALSNALQRAGISNVVLEKHRDIVYPSGASIGIWPNGARLLQQLGCLEAIESASANMTVSYNRTPDGKAVITSQLFDAIIQRHGYRFLLLERQEFIRALYESLPSKEPVRTGKSVSGITEMAHGVRVFLKDGTFEDGDIVVGCDGVASSVRQCMWDHANEAVPNTICCEEKRALSASYKCLVGVSPRMPGAKDGSMTVVHNDGFSFLVMTHPRRTFFFVFIKLDKTYFWPAFPKYTQEDVDRQAATLAALPIDEQLLFGELWAQRVRGEMVNIEEGLFKHWHSGRVVLAGDAAHKFTPNIAFGGISAIESVATLANILHAKLQSMPEGLSSHPNRNDISSIFQSYQEQRIPRVRKIYELSGFMTRVQAWDNLGYKIVARYVFPWVSDARVADLFADVIKGAVKLDYLALAKAKSGSVPWKGDSANVMGRGISRKSLAAFGTIVLSIAVLGLLRVL